MSVSSCMLLHLHNIFSNRYRRVALIFSVSRFYFKSKQWNEHLMTWTCGNPIFLISLILIDGVYRSAGPLQQRTDHTTKHIRSSFFCLNVTFCAEHPNLFWHVTFKIREAFKKKKGVTFFTLGGGQDRSSLHFFFFSKTWSKMD